jgi:hypothetical protein
MLKTQEETDSLRFLRKGDWYINQGLTLDQEVIEETVRNLRPTRCPVCRGNLSHKDNFGTRLSWSREAIEGYCPTDDYIIRLESRQYVGNTAGTQLFMSIFTNSRYSRLVADSGRLADFSSPDITLRMFS